MGPSDVVQQSMLRAVENLDNFQGNTVDSAGNLVPVKGKYVEIWKKQADGSWKVAVDMFSTDSLSGPVF